MNDGESLLTFLADGNDHPSPLRELLDQRFRHIRGGRCDHDAIEGGHFRPTQTPVPGSIDDVSDVQRIQQGLSLLPEKREALDGVHFASQSCQDRGLVARASADFQNAVFRLDVEVLGHDRDHEGLRDRLAAFQGHRTIAERSMLLRGRDEPLPWYLGHESEHPLIHNAAGPDLLLDHSLTGFKTRIGDHRGPASWHDLHLIAVGLGMSIPRPRGCVAPWSRRPYNETMNNPARRHLLETTLDDLGRYCAQSELPAYRPRQVLDWVYKQGAADFETMTNLPRRLREQLAKDWVIHTATEARRQVASDGTTKLLLAWPDGATSECVLIPDHKRRTACISSQVGCPVGCAFCASGLNGLQRNLTAGQIVEQAMRVRQLCAADPATPERLGNIVLMGLGEPLANYDAVLQAVSIINAEWGMGIGARSITLSTVGLPTRIRQLAGEGLQVNLAVSLHAPTDELRQELIPWARNVSIAELTDAVRNFFERTHREVTLEYILLGGVNDTLEHASQLVTICRRMRCNVNLIRYNPVPGLPFERPTSQTTHAFVDRLRERGVNAHVRKSRGLDIDAACGQLRRTTGKPVTADLVPGPSQPTP